MSFDAVFTEGGVRFVGYPYPAARIYPNGVLPVSSIRDVDATAAPPEIRSRTGETLFVPALRHGELEGFCRAEGVVMRHRSDVWADLLAPFLDTDSDADGRFVSLARLNRAGLADVDVERIRYRVGPVMRAYNAFHWEWAHLGLNDLLDAALVPFVPRRLRCALGDFPDLYAWAMNIAELGAAEPVD